EECQDQINKYPNSKFKRFYTLEEAQDFISGIEKEQSYYAVRIGRKPGIYRTWLILPYAILHSLLLIYSCQIICYFTISLGFRGECQDQIRKYPYP
ncbi:8155_t:CDS:1, partial [Dentiscutata erythropus]